MLSHGQVRFLFDGAQMFTEPVPEPASGFANVHQSACTTSNKVNEVTRRAQKSLSDRQRATRGVDLGRCVCVGVGLTPWAVTGKGSSQVILRTSVRLETAADQGVF